MTCFQYQLLDGTIVKQLTVGRKTHKVTIQVAVVCATKSCSAVHKQTIGAYDIHGEAVRDAAGSATDSTKGTYSIPTARNQIFAKANEDIHIAVVFKDTLPESDNVDQAEQENAIQKVLSLVEYKLVCRHCADNDLSQNVVAVYASPMFGWEMVASKTIPRGKVFLTFDHFESSSEVAITDQETKEKFDMYNLDVDIDGRQYYDRQLNRAFEDSGFGTDALAMRDFYRGNEQSLWYTANDSGFMRPNCKLNVIRGRGFEFEASEKIAKGDILRWSYTPSQKIDAAAIASAPHLRGLIEEVALRDNTYPGFDVQLDGTATCKCMTSFYNYGSNDTVDVAGTPSILERFARLSIEAEMPSVNDIGQYPACATIVKTQAWLTALMAWPQRKRNNKSKVWTEKSKTKLINEIQMAAELSKWFSFNFTDSEGVVHIGNPPVDVKVVSKLVQLNNQNQKKKERIEKTEMAPADWLRNKTQIFETWAKQKPPLNHKFAIEVHVVWTPQSMMSDDKQHQGASITINDDNNSEILVVKQTKLRSQLTFEPINMLGLFLPDTASVDVLVALFRTMGYGDQDYKPADMKNMLVSFDGTRTMPYPAPNTKTMTFPGEKQTEDNLTLFDQYALQTPNGRFYYCPKPEQAWNFLHFMNEHFVYANNNERVDSTAWLLNTEDGVHIKQQQPITQELMLSYGPEYDRHYWPFAQTQKVLVPYHPLPHAMRQKKYVDLTSVLDDGVASFSRSFFWGGSIENDFLSLQTEQQQVFSLFDAATRETNPIQFVSANTMTFETTLTNQKEFGINATTRLQHNCVKLIPQKANGHKITIGNATVDELYDKVANQTDGWPGESSTLMVTQNYVLAAVKEGVDDPFLVTDDTEENALFDVADIYGHFRPRGGKYFMDAEPNVTCAVLPMTYRGLAILLDTVTSISRSASDSSSVTFEATKDNGSVVRCAFGKFNAFENVYETLEIKEGTAATTQAVAPAQTTAAAATNFVADIDTAASSAADAVSFVETIERQPVNEDRVLRAILYKINRMKDPALLQQFKTWLQNESTPRHLIETVIEMERRQPYLNGVQLKNWLTGTMTHKSRGLPLMQARKSAAKAVFTPADIDSSSSDDDDDNEWPPTESDDDESTSTRLAKNSMNEWKKVEEISEYRTYKDLANTGIGFSGALLTKDLERVFDVLFEVDHSNTLEKSTRLLDIGCSVGKPNMFAAAMYGVGGGGFDINTDAVRMFNDSVKNVKSMGKEKLLPQTLAAFVNMKGITSHDYQKNDAEMLTNSLRARLYDAYPFTHAYSFCEGFTESKELTVATTAAHMCGCKRLVLVCKQTKYRQAKLDSHWTKVQEIKNISMEGRTTTGFTGYVYEWQEPIVLSGSDSDSSDSDSDDSVVIVSHDDTDAASAATKTKLKREQPNDAVAAQTPKRPRQRQQKTQQANESPFVFEKPKDYPFLENKLEQLTAMPRKETLPAVLGIDGLKKAPLAEPTKSNKRVKKATVDKVFGRNEPTAKQLKRKRMLNIMRMSAYGNPFRNQQSKK